MNTKYFTYFLIVVGLNSSLLSMDSSSGKVSVEELFYKAARLGDEQSLDFIKQHFDDWDTLLLKKILKAPKSGGVVNIYVPMFDDYRREDAYELFGSLLIKFPTSTAQLLTVLLKKRINRIIMDRSNPDWSYGSSEIGWLQEELKSLEN